MALTASAYSATTPRRTAVWLITVSGLAIIGALALATGAPLATVVLGLLICGLLHHVLEYRYLAGRFTGLFATRVWGLLGILITGILLTRTGWLPHPQYLEILLGYLVVAVAVGWGLHGVRRTLGFGILITAATVSWVFPAWHFVILTHLHNVLPLCFLWEWSRRFSSSVRWGFRGVHLLWAVLLPILILAGLMDPWLNADPSLVARFIGDGQVLIAMHAPPDTSLLIGTRFLTVFALMQTMHYVTWIVLMPWLTPQITARVERRVPAIRGWRLWIIGLAAAGLLGIVFILDWFEGRAAYSMLASYHAYLEYPILLALLLGSGSNIDVNTRSPAPVVSQP